MGSAAISGRRFTELTPTRQALLDAIVEYKEEHDGVAPTMRELMALTDMSSTSVVSYHLGQLERRGFISRRDGLPRSIEVLLS
jgi:repressor LexA